MDQVAFQLYQRQRRTKPLLPYPHELHHTLNAALRILQKTPTRPAQQRALAAARALDIYYFQAHRRAQRLARCARRHARAKDHQNRPSEAQYFYTEFDEMAKKKAALAETSTAYRQLTDILTLWSSTPAKFDNNEQQNPASNDNNDDIDSEDDNRYAYSEEEDVEDAINEIFKDLGIDSNTTSKP